MVKRVCDLDKSLEQSGVQAASEGFELPSMAFTLSLRLSRGL